MQTARGTISNGVFVVWTAKTRHHGRDNEKRVSKIGVVRDDRRMQKDDGQMGRRPLGQAGFCGILQWDHGTGLHEKDLEPIARGTNGQRNDRQTLVCRCVGD